MIEKQKLDFGPVENEIVLERMCHDLIDVVNGLCSVEKNRWANGINEIKGPTDSEMLDWIEKNSAGCWLNPTGTVGLDWFNNHEGLKGRNKGNSLRDCIKKAMKGEDDG